MKTCQKLQKKESLECWRMHIWALKTQKLKWALDPSHTLLTLLMQLCFTMSATFGLRSWGPPRPNPGSAPVHSCNPKAVVIGVVVFILLNNHKSVVTIALLTIYFIPCNVNCTPIKFIQFLGSVWSTILCDSLQYISHIICKLIQLEHEKVIKHLWPPVTCSERKNAICLTNSRWAHEVSRQVQLCWTDSI